MPKLSTLKPRLGGIGTRIGVPPRTEAERDRHRQQTQQSKTWLRSAWWLKTRQRILLRDRYQCVRCKAVLTGKGEAYIDHIKPHRENRALFFCEDAGLQTLCRPCHSSEKQREEQSEIKGVWY